MIWLRLDAWKCISRGQFLSGQDLLRRTASSRLQEWHRHRYSHEASTHKEQDVRQENLHVGHSHFISRANPGDKWKPGFTSFDKKEEPSVDELEGVSGGRGKLLPTSTHLFKLILPLGDLSSLGNTHHSPHNSKEHQGTSRESRVPPTVMLLHPSQPLSHVSSLIRDSLSPATPTVSFRSRSTGGNAFQWTDSTDVGNFIRDAARSAVFFICLTYKPSKQLDENILRQDQGKMVKLDDNNKTKGASRLHDTQETVIEVQVPTFADRTRYLRRKLNATEREIESMEELKLHCDKEAHRGARRMALTGFGMLVVYWGTVARLTFWDFGWDVMEPITYLSGLSTVILGYLWFLYQGREVSYSSVLAQSISRRRDTLYKSHGFDVERWLELVGQRKSLRQEIGRIAEDYEERVAHGFEEEPADELNEKSAHDGEHAELPGSNLAKSEGQSEGRKEENIGRKMATKADKED